MSVECVQLQLEGWIAHDCGHCIDQHPHAAVAVGAEELAGDRRLLARSGIVVDRLRDLIVTDRVDGLLVNSPVRVERCFSQHLRITSRVAVVGPLSQGYKFTNLPLQENLVRRWWPGTRI